MGLECPSRVLQGQESAPQELCRRAIGLWPTISSFADELNLQSVALLGYP